MIVAFILYFLKYIWAFTLFSELGLCFIFGFRAMFVACEDYRMKKRQCFQCKTWDCSNHSFVLQNCYAYKFFLLFFKTVMLILNEACIYISHFSILLANCIYFSLIFSNEMLLSAVLVTIELSLSCKCSHQSADK